MIKANDLKKLLNKLVALEKKQNEFLDSIPSEIRSGFFYNTYTSCLQQQINLLMRFSLDNDNLSEDVSYFLYETYPQKIYIKNNGIEKEYVINSVDDFINYLIDTKQIKNDFLTI